jgi:hypothetical protein
MTIWRTTHDRRSTTQPSIGWSGSGRPLSHRPTTRPPVDRSLTNYSSAGRHPVRRQVVTSPPNTCSIDGLASTVELLPADELQPAAGSAHRRVGSADGGVLGRRTGGRLTDCPRLTNWPRPTSFWPTNGLPLHRRSPAPSTRFRSTGKVLVFDEALLFDELLDFDGNHRSSGCAGSRDHSLGWVRSEIAGQRGHSALHTWQRSTCRLVRRSSDCATSSTLGQADDRRQGRPTR